MQHRVAAMAIDVETSYLWLHRVASLWDQGRADDARVAGSRARHVIEHASERVVRNGIRICGARSLIRPSVLERALRDLTFYYRHDNDDQVLSTVGRAAPGNRVRRILPPLTLSGALGGDGGVGARG